MQFFTPLVDSTFSLLCSLPPALCLSLSLSVSGWSLVLLPPPRILPQLNRLCLYSKLLPNKRHGTISPKLSARTWICGANKPRLVLTAVIQMVLESYWIFFFFLWAVHPVCVMPAALFWISQHQLDCLCQLPQNDLVVMKRKINIWGGV